MKRAALDTQQFTTDEQKIGKAFVTTDLQKILI